MKRFLLLLAFCLGLGIANAQLTEIYVNDGYVLTDNQWHFGDYSVVEANDGYFMVISPSGYQYCYLGGFNPVAFTSLTGYQARTYRPYIYGSVLGWYVQTDYIDYFMYPYRHYYNVLSMSTAPVYYNYYYALMGIHYINMCNWHFSRPHHHRPVAPAPHGYRPPHHHHGTHNPPPPHNGNNHGGRPPQGHGSTARPQGNGSGPSTYRPSGSGTTVRPPSGNGTGSTHRPPQNGSRPTGTTVRPAQGGGRSSGTVSRPAPSSRPSGSTYRAPAPTSRPAPSGGRSGSAPRTSGGRR